MALKKEEVTGLFFPLDFIVIPLILWTIFGYWFWSYTKKHIVKLEYGSAGTTKIFELDRTSSEVLAIGDIFHRDPECSYVSICNWPLKNETITLEYHFDLPLSWELHVNLPVTIQVTITEDLWCTELTHMLSEGFTDFQKYTLNLFKQEIDGRLKTITETAKNRLDGNYTLFDFKLNILRMIGSMSLGSSSKGIEIKVTPDFSEFVHI
ncbi:hypothetical protein H6761_00545 [Candidatus Nomurabacteria bacterium]|nr:hypothetical protein [Candidatus Nomurabacteria bacterium]